MKYLFILSSLLLTSSAAFAQVEVTKLPGEENLSRRERAERDFLMPVRHKQAAALASQAAEVREANQAAEAKEAAESNEDSTAAPESDNLTARANDDEPEPLKEAAPAPPKAVPHVTHRTSTHRAPARKPTTRKVVHKRR